MFDTLKDGGSTVLLGTCALSEQPQGDSLFVWLGFLPSLVPLILLPCNTSGKSWVFIFSTAFQWAAEVTSQVSLHFLEEHSFLGGIRET